MLWTNNGGDEVAQGGAKHDGLVAAISSLGLPELDRDILECLSEDVLGIQEADIVNHLHERTRRTVRECSESMLRLSDKELVRRALVDGSSRWQVVVPTITKASRKELSGEARLSRFFSRHLTLVILLGLILVGVPTGFTIFTADISLWERLLSMVIWMVFAAFALASTTVLSSFLSTQVAGVEATTEKVKDSLAATRQSLRADQALLSESLNELSASVGNANGALNRLQGEIDHSKEELKKLNSAIRQTEENILEKERRVRIREQIDVILKSMSSSISTQYRFTVWQRTPDNARLVPISPQPVDPEREMIARGEQLVGKAWQNPDGFAHQMYDSTGIQKVSAAAVIPDPITSEALGAILVVGRYNDGQFDGEGGKETLGSIARALGAILSANEQLSS